MTQAAIKYSQKEISQKDMTILINDDKLWCRIAVCRQLCSKNMYFNNDFCQTSFGGGILYKTLDKQIGIPLKVKREM